MYELKFSAVQRDEAQFNINWAIIPLMPKDVLEEHVLNMVTPQGVTTTNRYDVHCVVVAGDNLDDSTEYYYYSVRADGVTDPIGWCSDESGYLVQSGTYEVRARVIG